MIRNQSIKLFSCCLSKKGRVEEDDKLLFQLVRLVALFSEGVTKWVKVILAIKLKSYRNLIRQRTEVFKIINSIYFSFHNLNKNWPSNCWKKKNWWFNWRLWGWIDSFSSPLDNARVLAHSHIMLLMKMRLNDWFRLFNRFFHWTRLQIVLESRRKVVYGLPLFPRFFFTID